jgi:hypothetical protein
MTLIWKLGPIVSDMKSNIVFVLIFLGVLSCQDSNTTDISKLDTSDKIEISFDKIENSWTEIENRDGKWVVFEPCDDAIFTINFSKKEGKNYLNIGWGQEQEDAFINNIFITSDSTIVINARDTSNSYDINLTYKVMADKSKWHIIYPDKTIDHEKYLTNSKNLGKFAKVRQPCKECWDDEICDSLIKK